MEQKYVYLSDDVRFSILGEGYVDFLDRLEDDIDDVVDENFDEKETCLEMLKRFLKDKILTEEDYNYLEDKAGDYYWIPLPYVVPRTQKAILQEIFGEPSKVGEEDKRDR